MYRLRSMLNLCRP